MQNVSISASDAGEPSPESALGSQGSATPDAGGAAPETSPEVSGASQVPASLRAGEQAYAFYPVSSVAGAERLPYSLKVLLENILRNVPDQQEANEQIKRIVDAGREGAVGLEIEFSPARVLFQDFTGVPVFVDFAVMREACKDLGGDPARINPCIPCDLVIDHAVIADVAGCADALEVNMAHEYERNAERYEFLKWAQQSFENVRIVAPGKGICHQLNIEQFASVVMTVSQSADGKESRGEEGVQVDAQEQAPLAYFDTLVGSDSHTPTANGLGVLGWGVGGIEAEACALARPVTTLVPKVVGINLSGALMPGVSAMDVSLTFAKMLREAGVVGCFVECFGEGLAELSATQRACISNMTPEYGCTCTLFPVDDKTLEYLRLTGRSEQHVALVEAYAKAQGFWHDPRDTSRVYAQVIDLDLSQIRPMCAGPSRPHEGIVLDDAQMRFREICESRGLGKETTPVTIDGQTYELGHGTVAIAAVTSCTTATDPAMMIACGLVARAAVCAGLTVKPWVKTILAPGSHATELLLERAGLKDFLEQLGFYTCGFGCMSCIGNSGPLSDAMHEASQTIELASVLSGNRNFEGRISPDVSQNYLMSPAYVIAYALAGTMDIDWQHDPLGTNGQGNPVYLADILPQPEELDRALATYVTQDLYAQGAADLFEDDPAWASLGADDALDVQSSIFSWDPASTYVRRPPYFDGMTREIVPPQEIKNAIPLALLGDFITTDHISPAGAIAPSSPAAHYLEERGVLPSEFNTYGSRRGNHEVMMRGTFANVKLANKLAKGKLGGVTRDALDGEIKTIFDAACHYDEDGDCAIVLAGKMYGSGSSRDWAAKGPYLLGVRAVIAESFERIHRSNLIGMGIAPLEFMEGENADTLGLDGTERYCIGAIDCSAGLPQPANVFVCAQRDDGSEIEFKVKVRIDTPTEGAYFYNGGILEYVLRGLVGLY